MRRPPAGRSVWLIGGGVALLAAALSVAPFLYGLSRRSAHAYGLAPESALSETLRKAPPKVREAYRFAIANRDILRQIPCYCGCGAQHRSNAECYIKDVTANEKIEFDLMSYG